MGEAEFLAGGGEMGRLMRELDWSRTPLGDTATWPQSLRTSVSTCLNSRFPILIWWGREYAKLYNDAYRPMLGNKHPRSMGSAGRDVWPEIWDIIGPMLDSVLQEGAATWSEDQMLPLHRKGYVEECYFTFSYSPIRDESGGVGGVFTAVNETTGRVLGERRLAILRELSARLADSRNEDEACRIAAQTLGGDPQDVPFALLYLVPPNDHEFRLTAVVGVEHGIGANGEIELVDGDDLSAAWPLGRLLETGTGEVVRSLPAGLRARAPGPWPNPPEAALALPIARSGQKPYGVIVLGLSPRLELDESYRGFFSLVAGQVATAIGNARAYEEERERAEALAEIDRAKTTFFSNISHEFRTPLTLLLGPVEDALRNAPERDRQRLELIQRNALRLKKLVNTLLDFSRIEAGRVEATFEPVDFSHHTTELASMFRSATERAGLNLTVDAPELSQPVYVDRDLWEKVVLNLLSNAFKFTFEGGIRVLVREHESHVELSVGDTGTGIAPDDLQHIFQRFHRVEGARSRTHEGSGIGLALVKELVELHGGTIAVESQVDLGTTFTVRLPLGTGHLPARQIGPTTKLASTALGAAPFVEEALRWLPDAPSDGKSGGAAGVAGTPTDSLLGPVFEIKPEHILVADDNADMRDYLRHVLELSWVVTTVPDGVAALEVAREVKPDLVLTDVMMPRLDGFGLLKALRSDPATRDLPILMLSARAGEEAHIEGIEAGADDYLVKPFRPRELQAKVRVHLEMARVRREVVAERQRLLEAEQEARRAAESANEAKARFLATMSHELRTPLNAILGYCNLLEDEVAGPLVAGQRAQLQRIDGASRHLLQIIEQILSHARIEAGKEEVHVMRVDLTSLVREAAAYMEPIAASKRLSLDVRVPPTPVRVATDPSKVRQILLNLLANAIKFTATGRVGLELTAGASEVAIHVSDTGVGIPAKDLDLIFEAFHQVRSGAAWGTGLGLSVSRELARLLGGELVATSEQHRGSVFTLHLPVGDESRDDLAPSPAEARHRRAPLPASDAPIANAGSA